MGAAEEQQQQQENEDHVRGTRGTAITQTQFQAWKLRKDADTSARKAEAARKRAEDIASGAVQMNGRELFIHQPWVFDNDH